MNGKSKIGARELEIVEYLQEKGEESYTQLLVIFSPVNHAIGGRTYNQYNICEDRLRRMQKKGLIVIEGRTVRLAV